MTAVQNHPITVSIHNQIEIYPLNNGNAFYQVDERDNIFIFGTNYIFKLKLKKSDILINQRYLNFEDWISYVIHAGICLLDTSTPELCLKVGISLKDYYQSYAEFSDIISSKRVKFMFNGNLKSKPIYIRRCDIFPNLYGQALAISENNDLDNLVVLNLTIETLEGIYFEKGNTFLSQKYVLGSGFKELVNLQESSANFETDYLLEELQNNESQPSFDTFYNQYVKKKIGFICKKSASLRIFYIENGEVSPSFHRYFKVKLAEFGQVDSIYDGSSLAANGFFGVKVDYNSNLAEDVSVSVFSDHSTFVMRKEK